MARNSKNQNSQPKAPDYLAWHIQQKGEQSFWTRIGACWMHKDKKGMSLQLDMVPINGLIVLRQPLENPTADEGRA